jgi:hypothetical protein
MHIHELEELHPIDLVQSLAQTRDWVFERQNDDEIALVVEGLWRQYAVSLMWSDTHETLRLVCSFEFSPPQPRLAALYETLNLANDRGWSGAFSFWQDQQTMAYIYGLNLAGGALASTQQVDNMVRAGVAACEKLYPAFQLVSWGDDTPEQAMRAAISDAYGRA